MNLPSTIRINVGIFVIGLMVSACTEQPADIALESANGPGETNVPVIDEPLASDERQVNSAEVLGTNERVSKKAGKHRKPRGPTRPCSGKVALYVDETLLWERSTAELRELEGLVVLEDKRNRGKQALPVASLLDQADGIIAVEIGSCRGRDRRFERAELEARRDLFYLVVTSYRGFKLHNIDGVLERGAKMKNIDRIRLLTSPGL